MRHRLAQKSFLRRRCPTERPAHPAHHRSGRNFAHRSTEERKSQSCRDRSEEMTMEAPNTKLQAPEKLQISNSNIFGAWRLVFLWSLMFGSWSLSAAPALTDLQCFPTNVNLTSAKSTQHLVVLATYADGITRDITDQAGFKLSNPKLVRLDHANLS